MLRDLKNLDLKNFDFKNPKTQAMILIILIGIAAVILYLYFIFIPQVLKDIMIIGKTVKIKNELRSAKSLIAETDRIKKKLAEYNNKVELYEKKLPAEQEIPILLENLSNMARSANITIVGISPAVSQPQKEKSGQVYQEIPILITAKCGYHELGRFLSKLENTDRFMKVVDISIKADRATPKKHDVELMVCTYILPPER